MMRIHLGSIRQFHPAAPILVSKKGDDREEMEGYRLEFGIRYWLEDCSYVDALLRLLGRCETEYVCIVDHDAVLLSSLDPLLGGLQEDRYDLVGIEERILEPPGTDWKRLGRNFNGWWRFAPGFTGLNFAIFNLRQFVLKWGLRGIRRNTIRGTWNSEYYYGICQKLKRHKYLLPYHIGKYGVGNLLKDGDTAVAWHQWYGSHRTRLQGAEYEASQPGVRETIAVVERGEHTFLADYPHLDFSDPSPAWGPDRDVQAEQLVASQMNDAGLWESSTRDLARVRQWPRYGLRKLIRGGIVRLGRWRRFL